MEQKMKKTLVVHFEVDEREHGLDELSFTEAIEQRLSDGEIDLAELDITHWEIKEDKKRTTR
jgi:hypothetical protein